MVYLLYQLVSGDVFQWAKIRDFTGLKATVSSLMSTCCKADAWRETLSIFQAPGGKKNGSRRLNILDKDFQSFFVEDVFCCKQTQLNWKIKENHHSSGQPYRWFSMKVCRYLCPHEQKPREEQ